MISNAHIAMEVALGEDPVAAVNPLTKLWHSFDKNPALMRTFGEYVKLAQITKMHVLGSVEDERTFSSLTFLKNTLRNCLDTNLGIVVGMHAQQIYNLQTFPYDDCFRECSHSSETKTRYACTA